FCDQQATFNIGMPTQILQIKPELELTFRGPFDKVVTSTLRLRNPGSDVVAFKVKTTAPKRYCVRPNSGLVQPNSEVEVAVMLQPFEYDPAEKARHKFMVQSLLVKSGAVESLDELWKSATAETLMDSKLKVVLDPGTDQARADPTNQATATSTPSPAGEKQNQQQQQQAAAKQPQKQQQDGSSPTAPRKEPSAPSAAAAGSPDSLRSLQSEIQRLKDDNARLQEQELRLRKLAMRDTKSSDLQQQQQQSEASMGQMQQQQQQSVLALPPVLFLVLALVLGLIVGKFIL
ncbi:hypothetical protein BOX15_Mlig031492g4, partial [Macrostomum lignano]